MKTPTKSELLKEIPKEHLKIVKQLLVISYNEGVSDAFGLVNQAISVPADKIHEYGVYNNDDIDGG